MKNIYALSILLLIATSGFAQLTLTTDSVLQTSTCAGGNVIVPSTVTGGNYTFGNVFTAQLSDMWGSFANPVNIGSMPFLTGSGIIIAKIPLNTNFGFLYRIRVIASNPKDTGSVSPNTIVVTQVAQLNTILTTPNDTICQGDTATLTAVNFANSYSWNTGDTTQSIKVTTGGIYTVTTKDMLGCKSTTADTISVKVCTSVNEVITDNSFMIYPNPANNLLNIKFLQAYRNGMQIRVYNILGKIIYVSEFDQKIKSINTSTFEQGLYFVELSDGKQTVVKKITVTR
jgi:hypothetical protein